MRNQLLFVLVGILGLSGCLSASDSANAWPQSHATVALGTNVLPVFSTSGRHFVAFADVDEDADRQTAELLPRGLSDFREGVVGVGRLSDEAEAVVSARIAGEYRLYSGDGRSCVTTLAPPVVMYRGIDPYQDFLPENEGPADAGRNRERAWMREHAPAQIVAEIVDNECTADVLASRYAHFATSLSIEDQIEVWTAEEPVAAIRSELERHYRATPEFSVAGVNYTEAIAQSPGEYQSFDDGTAEPNVRLFRNHSDPSAPAMAIVSVWGGSSCGSVDADLTLLFTPTHSGWQTAMDLHNDMPQALVIVHGDPRPIEVRSEILSWGDQDERYGERLETFEATLPYFGCPC